MSHETIMFKDCKIIGLYNRGQYKEYNNDLTDFLWEFGIKYNIDKLIA